MDFIYKAFDGMPLTVLNNRMKYLVNTLTDHVPATPPQLIQQIADEFFSAVDFDRCDKLVGEEDRGGYLTAIMGLLSAKPFTLVKWHPLGLEGEHSVNFESAYATGSMYLNGVLPGERIIIVEDFIDTGGTILALIELMRKIGAEVLDVIAVVDKVDNQARDRILRKTGILPKVLISVSAEGKVSRIVKRHLPAAK